MHSEIHAAWMLPFAALLASIAFMPLINPHAWEKRYPLVALPLGLVVACYYLIGRGDTHFVIHTLYEYFSFIALVGALFTVTGGIHMTVKGEATPTENTVFLAIGSVLANLIGTTGASMLMIRPWLRMNRHRIGTFHVVFFIFLVSNVGGCLTPIGDPPLFLGFLKGVPFFWITKAALPAWTFMMVSLLCIFWALDMRSYKNASAALRKDLKGSDAWGVGGASNILFLAAIIGSVFITKPVLLREAVMLGAAFLAYRTTPAAVRSQNNFNFAPIREVAILFLGIFMTMMPALQWMESHAAQMGISSPRHFFWATGILSAFLDNAPTYLNFLSVAIGLYCDPGHITQLGLAVSHGMNALRLTGTAPDEVMRTLDVLTASGISAGSGAVAVDQLKSAYLVANFPKVVQAISLGSVFFGAATYIGNGPNFLVKSIAEHEKIKTASFIGYLVFYSLPVLLPLFIAVSWLFLK